MLDKIKGFATIIFVLTIMVLGGYTKTKEMETKTTGISTQDFIEKIENNYNHPINVLSQTNNGKIECYFVYWTVPKVTIHTDGTEITKDMVQVHRYNNDGEYVDMAVGYTLDETIELFDTKF